jgi:hypothetical protein
MRLIFCLLISFTASNNYALELKDGSFYHECTYSSPKSASGYKPNPKIRYTIGFMNKSFKIGTLELTKINTRKGFAEGYFMHREGSYNRFTFSEPHRSLHIENFNKKGELTFIARYICSK